MAAEANIFYKGIRSKVARFEVGLSYYGPDGKNLKTYKRVDPYSYLRLYEQQTVRIDYHPHNTQKVILDDFQTFMDPMPIIAAFTCGFYFVMGVFVWLRRDFTCNIGPEPATNVSTRKKDSPQGVHKVLRKPPERQDIKFTSNKIVYIFLKILFGFVVVVFLVLGVETTIELMYNEPLLFIYLAMSIFILVWKFSIFAK